MNFEERRENLTEGEKLFVFFLYFNSAIHHYIHYSRLEFQRVCHNFSPNFGFAPREGLQATDNTERAGPKV